MACMRIRAGVNRASSNRSVKTFLIVASFAESILILRRELVRDLVAGGLCVHVAAPGLEPGGAVRLQLEAMGVKPHDLSLARTGTSALADISSLFQLYRLCRCIKPDAVLSYTIKPVIYGTVAGWLAGVPRRYALITGLGYAFTASRSGILIQVIRKLYRFALSCANTVFFQNADDEALFRSFGILSARGRSVVVNGSGVNLTRFAEQPFPVGQPSFLMIGRILADKGVREYVEAAKRVRSLYPEVRFTLVGWIDDKPDAITQSELDSWTKSGTIELHGKVSDVRPLIAECTVYVLPSYREGTPRTVLEAMATGRPIITTEAPGCRETVTDGHNGFLVPAQSVEALVAAMLRFIREPSLIQCMGRRSRELVEKKYDVRAVNRIMLREMGVAESALVDLKGA